MELAKKFEAKKFQGGPSSLTRQESTRVARADPMVLAQRARERKEIDTNFGLTTSESRNNLGQSNSIVGDSAPECHPLDTEKDECQPVDTKKDLKRTQSAQKVDKPAPLRFNSIQAALSGLQRTESQAPQLKQQHSHISTMSSGVGKSKAPLNIQGYLTLNCPDPFNNFSKPTIIAVLVDGKLREIELEVNWCMHRFIFTQGCPGEKPKVRKLWMGAIGSCAKAPADITHLLEVDSHCSWRLDSNNICVVGLRSGQRPLLFVFETAQQQADFINLCQHINYYFLTRMSSSVWNALEGGSETGSVPLNLLQDDVSLKTILVEFARQEPVFKDNFGGFAEFVKGVPCQVLYGDRIAKRATVQISFDNAGLLLVFDGLGNEVLPVQNTLCFYGSDAHVKLVRERKKLKAPPFLKDYFPDHRVCKEENLKDLDNWVCYHPMEWPSPIFLSFYSSKKTAQLEAAISLINKTLSSVMADPAVADEFHDIFLAKRNTINFDEPFNPAAAMGMESFGSFDFEFE
eukprot:GHVN01069946.1.p1 GENE.GHVN01069946.1~~GHVN01069946.1.p1  ORF type:complete len:516 (-),score=60.14 GHVN01069946.1:472-2019(-)